MDAIVEIKPSVDELVADLQKKLEALAELHATVQVDGAKNVNRNLAAGRRIRKNLRALKTLAGDVVKASVEADKARYALRPRGGRSTVRSDDGDDLLKACPHR